MCSISRSSGVPTKTRTSTELRWLTLVDDVASSAGAVRRLRTKLAPNPAWAELAFVDRAQMVTDGLLEVGPLRSRVAYWDEIAVAHRDLLDDGIPHWLSTVLTEGSRLDYAEIEELAVAVTAERFKGAGGGFLMDSVPTRLAELFEVLEFAGLITWHDRLEEPDPYGMSPLIVGGELSLTPLGRFTMVGPVRAAGYTFATLDDLSDADGLTVVNAVVTGSLGEDRALQLWHPDSPTVQRARLLADAAVEAEIAEQRLVAFHLLGMLEPPSDVGPAVRELLDTQCSGHAATFLLDHDLATVDEVGTFIDVGPLVDMLYSIIDEPAELDRSFRQVHAGVIGDLLEDLWRHDQPETIELLEALGRHVTDKELAKQARKAALKHRSWLANQGH